ncbi:MAG: flagellar hook-basal body complex protein, partial [Desulfuromonadaceae bacterium]|nr:flagellar hook-basal body complex protein [Desulfuromonadaceae bacterium]
MSLSSAMNVGITGLSTNAEAISVVGNNISNVNTVGFKEGRTLFSDILSSTIGAGQVGRGSQIQTVQNMFTQGSFENTASSNDLALQGDGMFVVENSTGQMFFTRAGAFDFNDQQILVNPDGLDVVGFGINKTTGLSNGVQGAIDKSKFTTMAAQATTSAAMKLNLDSTQTIPGVAKTSIITLTGNFGGAAPPATPSATQIFDEFGVAHTAAVTWGGSSPDYTYSVTISGVQAGTPGSAGSPIIGTLNYPTITNPPAQNLTFTNGAKSQPLTLNFTNIGNSGAAVAPSAVQNGSAGQKTGTVVASGGMNAAGINAATSLNGAFSLASGTSASVTGATTS